MKKRSIYEIEIFKNIYENNNIEKVDDNELIVYYIGSPYYMNNEVENNDKILPVYILWTNRNKGISKFIIYELNWLDISFVKISSKINFDGTISEYRFPQELANKYKNKISFGKKTIKLKNPLENFQYFDFKTITKEFNLFNRIKKYDENVLKNEKLLVFDFSDRKKLIIPAIEVVKYFYLNSKYVSLKKNILDENAMSRLVKELPLLEDEKNIHLNLNLRAKLKDKQLIFYFAYNEEYQNLFNDIYTKFLNEKVIYAPIPTKNNIKIKVHYYERDNYIYVLKILNSSHYKEEFCNLKKKVIVTHPKKTNIEYSKVDPKKVPKEDGPASDELGTNNVGTISSSIENVEIEGFNDFNIDEIDRKDFEFKLKMDEKKLDKTEEKTKTDYVNDEAGPKPLSSRDKKSTKGSSVGTNFEDDKKIGKALNYNNLVKKLKENTYEVEVYDGNLKNIADSLNSEQSRKFNKRIHTYIDKKETYRSYILIRIEKKNIVMFFFDIQARERYNKKTNKKYIFNRNSILLIENDLNLEKFHEEFIGKFIYEFSINFGKWTDTTNECFSEQRHFFLKHSSTNALFKSINEKFK